MDAEIYYITLEVFDNQYFFQSLGLDGLTSSEECERILKKIKVCVKINVDYIISKYYITCKKYWLKKNFPEMIGFALEEKTNNHLEWKPENFKVVYE